MQRGSEEADMQFASSSAARTYSSARNEDEIAGAEPLNQRRIDAATALLTRCGPY